jgi:hypothetical protein
MSDQYAALNGTRIVSGDVCIPYYGLWVADIVVADAIDLSTFCTLQIANLTLQGCVYRTAAFSGSRSARIIGGYGGWRKRLPYQSYNNPNGVKKSMVLRDAASIVGEQINTGTDITLGKFWVRESCIASEMLRLLVGETWYVDETGITQTSPRTNTASITSDFTVESWSGDKGRFDIAAEDVASWLPARTFSNANVTTPQKISMTNIHMSNEGKLRLNVLTTGPSDV